MKNMRIFLAIFSMFFSANRLYSQPSESSQYAFLHWRFGLSNLREINIGINPIPKVQKHFFAGFGYRYFSFISSDCLPERNQIGRYMHGPILSFGYDGVNKNKPSKEGFTVQFFYKLLKTDTIEYLETPCLFGEVHGDAKYRLYWNEAKIAGLRVYYELLSKDRWKGVYIALGFDFQFLTKHYLVNGTLDYPWEVNDYDKVTYFQPKLDFGIRLSAFGKSHRQLD